MIIKKAEFLMSNTHIGKCPKPILPEYAFVGRSNVGKSSLINMLVDNKKLAKTSSTPGKTQLINHFKVNGEWYLVDLPGYGYAKTSKVNREKWGKMLKSYIIKRKNLSTLFILVDARHKPQKIDVEFINWVGKQGVPFTIVLTKADKLSSGGLSKNLNAYKTELLQYWEELPSFIVSSSVHKKGREELLDLITNTNKIMTFKPLK